MSALVIESFPDVLYARLKEAAASHQRSLAQETIHQLEKALASEMTNPPVSATPASYWANRKLLPEYEAAMNSGAFGGGTDSTTVVSSERDAR